MAESSNLNNDDSPSPADFNMRSPLGNGYSIAKSARFSSPEEALCPQKGQNFTRSLSTNSENELYSKNLETLKRHAMQSNRSGNTRQSIRRKLSKSIEDGIKLLDLDSPSSSDVANEFDNNEWSVPKREEFIEDSYETFTSSEELEDLKNLEEYELNEVCKAIRRYQSSEWFIEETRPENVGMAILKTLRIIEKGVKDIKSGMKQLQQMNGDGRRMPQSGRNTTYAKKQPVESLKGMKTAVNKVMENLDRDLEVKRKSMMRSSEAEIRKVMKEIHNVNEKLARNVKKACKKSVEGFMRDLERSTKCDGIPAAFEYASEILNVSLGEEAMEIGENLPGEVFSPLSDESIEDTNDASLDSDIQNIIAKYNGTTNMLDAEGALIEILKNELADLKISLNKKKF